MWESSVDIPVTASPRRRGDTRRLFHAQVEELDERMQKLTRKLEKARKNFDYEKAQRMLDKIDAHQHEKELKVQEKLEASERKLEKAKKAGNAEDEEKYKGKIAKFQKKLDDMHVGAGNWQEVDATGHGSVRVRRGDGVRQKVGEDWPEGALRPYLNRVTIPAHTTTSSENP